MAVGTSLDAEMNWLKKLWRDWTTSKEMALLQAENKRLKESNFILEDENERLRNELRGAVNTLLSQAGVAPLPGVEEVKTVTPRIRRMSWQQRQRMYAVETMPKEKEA